MQNFNIFFSKAANISSEYCVSIVKLGKIFPIDGADNIRVTYINFTPIVIGKDQFKEGEYCFYAPNESELCEKFLSLNNLYDFRNYKLNKNADEVKNDIINNNLNEAKSKCGFFNSYGRVRTIKLRGQQSFGLLFSLENLKNAFPMVDIDYIDPEWENLEFDTVYGTQFIKPYIPRTNIKIAKTHSLTHTLDKNSFNRLKPDQFKFHYDTKLLIKEIYKFKADTNIIVTPKIHGTSAIYANIPTQVPVRLNIIQKFINKLVDWKILNNKYYISKFKEEYGFIYSSRHIIKNNYGHIINNRKYTIPDYEDSVWGYFAKLLQPLCEKDMTIYGEIVGYDGINMIQKAYDYRCEIGQQKFVPYRITIGKKELELEDVIKYSQDWTIAYPTAIMPLPILYKGTLKDLCSDIDWTLTNNELYTAIINSLKGNIKVLGMEHSEPLCKNKVPREGICIRIINDPMPECFKLKTEAFRKRELHNIDVGEIDLELTS